MSRCFPYPPPGYVRVCSSGDTLIDSIELQRDNGEAQIRSENLTKKLNIKKKSAVKESRNVKLVVKATIKEKNVGHKSLKRDSNGVTSAQSLLEKKTKDLQEQLENSDLTEELSMPSYSSDGTQSGDKRKRDALSSNSYRSDGRVFRIKLTSVKHKEVVAPIAEQPCIKPSTSDSYHQELSRPKITQFAPKELSFTPNSENTLFKDLILTPRDHVDDVPSTSKSNHPLPFDIIEKALELKSVSKKMLRKETKYKALIENWVALPFHNEHDDQDDDLQWLLGKKAPENHGAKRTEVCISVSCRDNYHLGPHASYISDFDIYALPYTIPF